MCKPSTNKLNLHLDTMSIPFRLGPRTVCCYSVQQSYAPRREANGCFPLWCTALHDHDLHAPKREANGCFPLWCTALHDHDLQAQMCGHSIDASLFGAQLCMTMISKAQMCGQWMLPSLMHSFAWPLHAPKRGANGCSPLWCTALHDHDLKGTDVWPMDASLFDAQLCMPRHKCVWPMDASLFDAQLCFYS